MSFSDEDFAWIAVNMIKIGLALRGKCASEAEYGLRKRRKPPELDLGTEPSEWNSLVQRSGRC